MADIKLSPEVCDDDDDCKRGKRGKRGHRGHRGPPGPASGGLLKFSGELNVDAEGGLLNTFLADEGLSSLGSVVALNYPVAVAHDFRNLATNITINALAPTTGTIIIRLLKNGVAVPGFSITYGANQTGIKTVLAGPVAYAIGDSFDLEASTSGFGIGTTIDLTATVGVE